MGAAKTFQLWDSDYLVARTKQKGPWTIKTINKPPPPKKTAPSVRLGARLQNLRRVFPSTLGHSAYSLSIRSQRV
jgi:hypothetical protein